jgi:hypothetical protein
MHVKTSGRRPVRRLGNAMQWHVFITECVLCSLLLCGRVEGYYYCKYEYKIPFFGLCHWPCISIMWRRSRRSAYPVHIKKHSPRAQVACYKLRDFRILEILNPFPYILEVYCDSFSKQSSQSEAIWFQMMQILVNSGYILLKFINVYFLRFIHVAWKLRTEFSLF